VAVRHQSTKLLKVFAFAVLVKHLLGAASERWVLDSFSNPKKNLYLADKEGVSSNA
jgi:hypothetical protein